MFSVTRWEPYRDMAALQNRLHHLLGETVAPYNAAEGVGTWMPLVDVVEESDRLIFRAELPGVKKEDIEVKVENGTLMLRGDKKSEKETDSQSAHRTERFFGSFSRSFSLPTTINAEKIQARYKDGVLELVLPKAEEAKPRRINILEA